MLINTSNVFAQNPSSSSLLVTVCKKIDRKPVYKIIGLASVFLAALGGFYLAGVRVGIRSGVRNLTSQKNSTANISSLDICHITHPFFNDLSCPATQLTIESKKENSFSEQDFLPIELHFETFMNERRYEKALEMALNQPRSFLKERHLENLFATTLSEKIIDTKFVFKIVQQMNGESQIEAFKKMFDTFLKGNHLDEALQVLELSSHHEHQKTENSKRLHSFIKHTISNPLSEEKFDHMIDAMKTSIEIFSSDKDNEEECYLLLCRFLFNSIDTALQQNNPEIAFKVFTAFPNNEHSQWLQRTASEKIVAYYVENNLFHEIVLLAKDNEKFQNALTSHNHVSNFLKSSHISLEKKVEIASLMVETFSEQNSKYTCEQVTNFLARQKKFREFLEVLDRSSLDSSLKNIYIINALTEAYDAHPAIQKKLIQAIDLSIPECRYVRDKKQHFERLQKKLEQLQKAKDSAFCSLFKNLLKEADCEIGNLIEKLNLKEEIENLKDLRCSSKASSSSEMPPLQRPGKSTNCMSVSSSCRDATCDELDPKCEDHAKIILELGNGPMDIQVANKQYRKISKRYHPDATTLDKEVALKAFHRLNEVKEVFL